MENCSICGKKYKSLYGVRSHLWRTHTEKGKAHRPGFGSHPKSWNKGKTALTDPRIAALTEKQRLTQTGRPGRPHSDSTKLKLSVIMKARHVNGTAHNIGKCRWMKEPSYPESFFMQVIANEFEDKNYTYELYFKKYSLDFAWEHKKLCIEIDGEQHEDAVQKARDIRKDALLVANGWKVLRIKWKDLFNNTKVWIQIAKDFLVSGEVVTQRTVNACTAGSNPA